MDYEYQLKALESRLLAVIETRDRSILEALEKVNLRLEKHRERMKDILERLRELEEKGRIRGQAVTLRTLILKA